MTKGTRSLFVGFAALAMAAVLGHSAAGAETPPEIVSLSIPRSGDMQVLFHGMDGPFRVQRRDSLEPSSPWYDLTQAKVVELNEGVFMGLFSAGGTNAAFYRLVSESANLPELDGWNVAPQVSTPSNGLYFLPGERPVVTVRILDNFAQGVTRDNLSTLALYMHGPVETPKTVTAVKLLNATTNRAANPHHYINLKTDPAVVVDGNTLTYTLQPVTDELPGTYTISVRAALASDPFAQIMKFENRRIGSLAEEDPIVTTEKCGACHFGPDSGKMYMHHIDPSSRGSGSWSLDFDPQNSCKACHNNEGYAAYNDASAPGGKVSDHIVKRVHGVHMGSELTSNFNTNSATGNFADYAHVEFPADVRNCTTCHVDNRWKTKPSRVACGSCHDNEWFGPTPAPAGMHAHTYGPQPNDTLCAACHTPDSPGLEPVSDSHEIPPTGMGVVGLTLSSPSNGTHYVAGEQPVATLVIYKDDGVTPIDHTNVTEGNFSTANFYVHGPRSLAKPVLTSAVSNGISMKTAAVTCSEAGPWAISNKVLRIAINGSLPQNITIVGASSNVTAAEVVASLNPVITNLNGGAEATVYSSTKVRITTVVMGESARIEIYNGDVTTTMGWKASGVVLEPDVTVPQNSSWPNDLLNKTYVDPMVTLTSSNITYQLGDVAGLTPGTYVAFSYVLAKPGMVAGIANSVGIGGTTFQVGTKTEEAQIASNCESCHSDTIMHLGGSHSHPAPFSEPDYCKACHDYGHDSTGEMYKNQGGTSLSGWSGYGATPLSRRVHGVHYGNYLEHPEEVYGNATVDTFGHIIFPTDVRNCTKCHAESDTWKQNPSRMACLACHDSDEAKAHGKLNTWLLDPDDPYGPTATETCKICHGANRTFSPDKVHSLNPFVPPYMRAPRGE